MTSTSIFDQQNFFMIPPQACQLDESINNGISFSESQEERKESFPGKSKQSKPFFHQRESFLHYSSYEFSPLRRSIIPQKAISQRNKAQLSQTNSSFTQNHSQFRPSLNLDNKQHLRKLDTTSQNGYYSQSTGTTSSNDVTSQTQQKTIVIQRKKINFATMKGQGDESCNLLNNGRLNISQRNYSNNRKRKKKNLSITATSTVRPSSSEMMTHKKLVFENPAPFVSSQSWVVLDKVTGEVVFGKNEFEPRQVASLTKIMTAYVVLDLVQRFKLNEHECLIRILPSSTKLIGTTSCLIPSDQITVWELLHGMMLPSGNDAAQSLAIHFGLLLLKEQFKSHQKNFEGVEKDILEIIQLDINDYLQIDERQDLIDKALNEFYRQMNRESMYLKLKNTNYCSSHGMHHDRNFSSAHDIAIVSHQCMKNHKFRLIVKSQKYTCESRIICGHLYQWVNTNKLLECGYSGLKTGITPTAGPCLAASITKNEFKFIIVILNAKSMDQRWVEVQKLVQWAMLKITKIKESDLKPKMKKKLLKKLQHL